jgi:hypothetical protein
MIAMPSAAATSSRLEILGALIRPFLQALKVDGDRPVILARRLGPILERSIIASISSNRSLLDNGVSLALLARSNLNAGPTLAA